MITDKAVIDNLLDHTDMGALMHSIPDEHIQYMIDFLDIPFLLEDQRDKEWIVYLYIIDILKWYITEDGSKAALNNAEILLELLNTLFDYKPEYRVERFYTI